MKDSWSDFEKYVFEKLEKLSSQVSSLKAQAALVGGIAGIIGVAVCEIVIRSWAK